jgi:UDP-3-O-acyl-N-acetylglucosamine deacetylase
MPEQSVTITGLGLHTGRSTAVTLRHSPESARVAIRAGSVRVVLEEWEVRDAHRGVRLGAKDDPTVEIESVEHLFAALGAWPVRRGLEIEVHGGEIPLAGGGALEFAEAIRTVAPPRDPPDLVVIESGMIEVGESSYSFEPGPEPRLEVEVEFRADAIGIQSAVWDGSFERFLLDVAWARTFGFRREAAALHARGRARGVDPRVVKVLDDLGLVEPPGAPARPGEFARHKLLDLVGDLYCFGGPPRGTISAKRPGHQATHRAVAIAFQRNLLALDRLPKSEDPGNLGTCERASSFGRSG